MNAARPSVLSIYSGAGGLDLGFRASGFRLLWANDVDAHACATYRQNLGQHIVEGDVRESLLPPGPVDVVIGGPPCQGWSRIGRMDPSDPRSEHVNYFFDVVEQLAPRAFVLENVAHLAEASRWSDVRERLLRRARQSLKYRTEIFVLDASYFGVAQARRRMFMVGVRGRAPQPPKPTRRRKFKTVRAALGELPAHGRAGNDTTCVARVVPARQPVMRPSAFQGALLFNGSGRPLDLDRPARTLPAAMGGNATPILDQDEVAKGADPWIVGYHQHLKQGGEPVAVAPPRLRRITVEEAAALQSFPKGFKFAGPTNAQYRQIGNSVPPALARAVARSLRSVLD